MGAAALLLTPPTPEGRGPPSLRPKPNPNNEKLFEEVQHYFKGKDLQVEQEAIRKAGYFEALENSQDSSIN